MNADWIFLIVPYGMIGFIVWMVLADSPRSMSMRCAVGNAVMWPIVAAIHAARGAYEAIVGAFK